MIVLGLDTATPETVVALTGAGAPVERSHRPPPGARPGHAEHALALTREVLAEARVTLDEVDRIAVGTGPGTFTGLRIGVATARGLAQATGTPVVAVGTLHALAGAGPADRAVLACLDARRGEAFVAAWRGQERLLAPAAVAPDALPVLVQALTGTERRSSGALGHDEGRSAAVGGPLAVGDGAVAFRAELEAAGAEVPPDDSALHRVSGVMLCRLGELATPGARDALLPEYVRAPDAVPRALQGTPA